MFDKIKEWLYWKYGVEFEKKHLWMIAILIFSVALLVLSVAFNGGFSGTKINPDDPLMDMPGGQMPGVNI